MLATINTLLRQLADGVCSAAERLASCVQRIEAADGEGRRAFPHGVSAAATAQAAASDALRRHGVAGPLAGIPVSVKDLFDIQGEVTRAGARVLPERAATADAVAIARLRAAGAVFVGRTNMTEFAYSGVGINPHYGTPRNPFERAIGRIPGGSSSGAAVSVADGMAVAAIGSDTGGSCRIPAALCGITGFKPTARRVPLQGTVPLSPSYDSIGCLAPTVACCAIVDAVMAGEVPVAPTALPARHLRLAIPKGLVLEDMDAHVATVYERALRQLANSGAALCEVEFDSWRRLAELGANGGLVAAEASAWHAGLMAEHGERYDPRVLSRIRLAAEQSAADYVHMRSWRAQLCTQADRELAPFDAVVLPTVPIIAPRIADLADDDAFFGVNRLLLRNPAIANMLDLCAISLPAHREAGAPVGLMLMGRHRHDHHLLAVAAGVEAQIRST